MLFCDLGQLGEKPAGTLLSWMFPIMARVFPFRPYRYADASGPLDRLVTQPYDKISAAMRQRYLSLSPHNLVRVILGERLPEDNESNDVYTRAAGHLNEWIAGGQLVQE